MIKLLLATLIVFCATQEKKSDPFSETDPKHVQEYLSQLEIDWRHDGNGNAIEARQYKQAVESKLLALKGKAVTWHLQIISITEKAITIRSVPKWSLLNKSPDATWSFDYQDWAKNLHRGDHVVFKAVIEQVEVNTRDQRTKGGSTSRASNFGRITGVLNHIRIEPVPVPKEKKPEEVSTKDDRKVWVSKNGNGRYEWLKGKSWKETTSKGPVLFEEVERNSDYIELQRADKLRIRLHNTISYWGGGNHGDGSYLWKENLAPGDSRGEWKKQ